MAADLAFACTCGKLKGRVAPGGPRAGTVVICYCKDCRAAAVHLKADRALTPDGGVPLFQTRPDHVHFDEGREHLACLRLSPKGLLRWYAACCGTPLANTMSTRAVPFASLSRAVFADPGALGPVTAWIHTASGRRDSGAPGRDKGMGGAALAFLGRAVAVWLSGKARVTPFFDADGQPVVTPQVILPEERRRAGA